MQEKKLFLKGKLKNIFFIFLFIIIISGCQGAVRYLENSSKQAYSMESMDMNKDLDLYKSFNTDLYKRYTVVFQKDTVREQVFFKNYNRADFISKVNEQNANGYRLTEVDTFYDKGEIKYFFTLRQSNAASKGIIEVTRNQLVNSCNTLRSQGWRVYKMSVCYKGGQDIYTAFFRKSNVDEISVFGLTTDDFIQESNRLRGDGYKINQFDVYVKRFSALLFSFL